MGRHHYCVTSLTCSGRASLERVYARLRRAMASEEPGPSANREVHDLPPLGSRLALRSAGTRKACDAVMLKRDEFGSAPPLNRSPLIPAKAGIQKPRARPKNWVAASATELGSTRVRHSFDLAEVGNIRLRLTSGIKRRFKLS